MKKKLYLMRHGQTVLNLRKKIQGSFDSPLTEEGIRQAKIAGLYFKENGITFDAAYSSTQERASDTLEIVTENKMPYKRLKGVKEWDFGVFEGESEALNPKKEHRAPGERSYGDFFVPYGGEGVKQVEKRMNDTLTEIMEIEGNNKVLVVSHGGACFAFFLKWIKDEDFETFNGFPNCCILKFEYENGKFEYKGIVKHDFEKEYNL